MTHLHMSDDEWTLAKTVCSPRQLAVMAHRRRGVSWRRIGRLLGISPTTARGHADAGRLAFEKALEREAA